MSKPVFRFEGRCLPPGRKINERKINSGLSVNDFTENQMPAIVKLLPGLPVHWGHKYPIGKVTQSWIDPEGWLCIKGLIYTDTASGRLAAADVESGLRKGLSLTHKYDLYPRIVDEPGWYENKEFIEVSICRPEQIERAGCLILSGSHDQNDERETIWDGHVDTLPKTMDAQKAAALQLELQTALDNIKTLKAENDKLGANVVEVTELGKRRQQEWDMIKAQLEVVEKKNKEALHAQTQELASYLPSTSEVTKTLEETTKLANGPEQVDTLRSFMTVLCENMHHPNREQFDREVGVIKDEATRKRTRSELLDVERKRYASADYNNRDRPMSMPTMTISEEDASVFRVIQEQKKLLQQQQPMRRS